MTNVWLLLKKDLLVLRRSPLLVVVLLVYPLTIALLIGLAAGYANTKPRVALVDRDNLPNRVVVANQTFYVDRTISAVAKNVRLVRMSRDEARRQLDSGQVVAVITIPQGFLATLQGLVRSPTLRLETASGGVAPRVRQQMEALVYALNLRLQRAFIAADLEYVNLLLHGGKGEVLGDSFDVLGLDGMDRLLKGLPHGPRLDAMRDFVHDARLALGLTDDAIRATASPIRLDEVTNRGRTAALSAQVQSYALGLTIAFLTLLLAAGALAAERDENVIGRLTRGLVGRGQLVAAKVALAAAVAVVVGGSIALVFGALIELGDVRGGEPWARLPLLFAGLVGAGSALGALGALVGALTRETRTASLVAILVVLPIVFMGLVPREIAPPVGWVSDAFPFSHSVRFFASALYDTSPWRTLWREALWLLGLTAIFGLAAREGARRLSV